MAKKLLGRDAIVAAEDRAFEDVDVPEWGGAVRLQEMSGTEHDAYITWLIGTADNPEQAALAGPKLVALCLVDDKGQRLFWEADLVELGKKSATVLRKIWAAAQRVNKMRDADIEALEKN